MVVKKSCVAALPKRWPDGRGISGRMRVERVAGSAWNRWPDGRGIRSKNQLFTIADKTKVFARFFKKIQYFQDETGLIYHGLIDGLRLYTSKGVGLRFAESVWVDKKRYRVWAHVPQERIEESRRRKAFVTEMDELEKAVKAGEQVHAFFVGAYPVKSTVEQKDGSQFEVYRAELLSVDHLSLVFAEPNRS